MGRPRFSLGTLLLLVLSTGVAFAALKSPSNLWASALFTLAVAVLLVATLGAVHRHDRSRAYLLGFALFGWVYLILSLVPETTPRLSTTGLLDALFARVHGHATGVTWLAYSPQGNRVVMQGAGLSTVRVWAASTGQPLSIVSTDPESFRRVGHSLLALLIACVGGRVSLHLHTARDRQPAGPPEGGGSIQAPTSVSRTTSTVEGASPILRGEQR